MSEMSKKEESIDDLVERGVQRVSLRNPRLISPKASTVKSKDSPFLSKLLRAADQLESQENSRIYQSLAGQKNTEKPEIPRNHSLGDEDLSNLAGVTKDFQKGIKSESVSRSNIDFEQPFEMRVSELTVDQQNTSIKQAPINTSAEGNMQKTANNHPSQKSILLGIPTEYQHEQANDQVDWKTVIEDANSTIPSKSIPSPKSTGKSESLLIPTEHKTQTTSPRNFSYEQMSNTISSSEKRAFSKSVIEAPIKHQEAEKSKPVQESSDKKVELEEQKQSFGRSAITHVYPTPDQPAFFTQTRDRHYRQTEMPSSRKLNSSLVAEPMVQSLDDQVITSRKSPKANIESTDPQDDHHDEKPLARKRGLVFASELSKNPDSTSIFSKNNPQDYPEGFRHSVNDEIISRLNFKSTGDLKLDDDSRDLQTFTRERAGRDKTPPARDRLSAIDDNTRLFMKDYKPNSHKSIEKIFQSKKFLEILRNVDENRPVVTENLDKINEEANGQSTRSSNLSKSQPNRASNLSSGGDAGTKLKGSVTNNSSNLRNSVAGGDIKRVIDLLPPMIIEEQQLSDPDSPPQSKTDLEPKSRSESKDVVNAQAMLQKKFKRLLQNREQKESKSFSNQNLNPRESLSGISLSMLVSTPVLPLNRQHSSVINTLENDYVKCLNEAELSAVDFTPPEECYKNLLVTDNRNRMKYELDLQESQILQPLSDNFFFMLDDKISNTSLGQPRAIELDAQATLYIGTSKGVIYLYESNYFTLEKLGTAQHQQDGGVSALKLFENQTTLLAGHETGRIVVWNLSRKVPIKKINYLTEPIIAIDTFEAEPMRFIVGNNQGRVSSFVLSKKFFGDYETQETLLLTKTGSAVVDIKTVLIREFNTRFSEASYEGFLTAIVAISRVAVVMMNPYPKIVQTISFAQDSESSVPCVCWGQIRKNGKEMMCLLTAHGRVVEIIHFSIEEEITCSVKYHLELEVSAACVEFIRPNLFSIIDSSNMLHMVHIDDFAPGPFKERGTVIPNLHYKDKLEGELFSPNLITTSNGAKPPHFHRSLLYVPFVNSFFSICKEGINLTKLYNEFEFLNTILRKGKYKKFLTVLIELINGNIKQIFPESPQGSLMKKQSALYNYVREKLLYCIYDRLLKGKEDKEDYMPNPKLVNRVARGLIDFCLETDLVDYLFTILKKSFELIHSQDIFYDALEPFILLNKVKWMPEAQLHEFILHLKNKGKLLTIHRLFLNLDLKACNTPHLIELCADNELMFPLIYVCTKGQNDYVTPLEKMLKAFNTSYSSDQNKRDKVQKDCLNIVWYLKRCLQSRELFSRLPIQAESLGDLILRASFFDKESIERFTEISASQFIPAYMLLFQGKALERLKDLKVNVNRSSDQGVGTQEVLVRVFNYVKEVLEKEGSKIPKNEAFSCLHFFIAGLAELNARKVLPENVALNSVRELLKHYELINKQLMLFYYKAQRPIRNSHKDDILGDIDKLIEQEIDDDFFVSRRDQLFVSLVKYCSETIKKDPDLLDELEIAADTSTYPSGRSYLSYLKGDIKRSIDVFTFKSVADKIRINVFPWIESLLSNKIQMGPENSLHLRDMVLERMGELVGISARHAKYLIEKYFDTQKIKIVKSLEKSPDLQLKFLEEVLEEITAENGSLISPEDYLEEIELYLKLLCQSKKKEHRKKVIQELRKYEGYYKLEDLLVVCQKTKAKECWAFIEESMGNVDSAIIIKLEIFEERLKKYATKRKELIPLRRDKLMEIIKGAKRTLNDPTLDENELEESWRKFIIGLSKSLSKEWYDNVNIPESREFTKEVMNEVTLEAANKMPYEEIINIIEKSFRKMTMADLKTAIHKHLLNLSFSVGSYKDAISSLASNFYDIELRTYFKTNTAKWSKNLNYLEQIDEKRFQTSSFDPFVIPDQEKSELQSPLAA